MRPLLAILLATMGAAAFAGDPVSTLREELRGLDLGSPESDAARDLAQGHPHCYSTNGLERWYPGVSRKVDQAYCSKIDRNFRGTSDQPWGKVQFQLILQAQAYARRYNIYVLRHRRNK